MQLRARLLLPTLLLPMLMGALADAAPKKPKKTDEAAKLRAELSVKDGDASAPAVKLFAKILRAKATEVDAPDEVESLVASL